MSGFILGPDVVAEAEDPLPTPVDTDSPIPVLAIGAPELDVEVTVPDLSTIEMEPLSTDVLVLPVAGPPGQDGAPGQDGQDGEGILTGICGQTLSGHRIVVMLEDRLYYADATTIFDATATNYLTLQAGLAEDEIDIVAHGRVEEPSWNWIPGRQLYLTIDGKLTQSVPESGIAFLRTMGTAETATRIYFNPQMPVVVANPAGYGGYQGGYGAGAVDEPYGYQTGYGFEFGPEYGTYSGGYGASAEAGEYGSYGGGYLAEEPGEDEPSTYGGYAASY